LKTHSLITSLKSLEGNAHRLCLYGTHLGIPYNLYIRSHALFMIALGLSDQADRPDMFSDRLGLPDLFCVDQSGVIYR